jgi:glycosyltransferase involved in cell wall biosynthesis
MRVLVVTQYFWPETFRINEVVDSLQEIGCDVAVLTSQPNYPDGKVFSGFKAWGCGRDKSSTNFKIFRVPQVPRGPSTAFRLALNYLSFVVSASLLGSWLLRRQKFDVIFIYGISPILQAIPGVVLKRQKHARLITWVQDLWPQSLEVTGFIKNRRLLKFVDWIVRWIYRHCDLLLVQSQAFVPRVQQMSSGTIVKYHPNPGELSFKRSSAVAGPVIPQGPEFNVIFAGNLGTVQALDTVLDSAELLLKHRHVQIIFVGSGSRADDLRQGAMRRGLSNVRFEGRLPSESMPAVLTRASALLVTLVSDPIMSQTIPSKVQAYLAAGRPIIACLDGEGARVVEEAGAGLTCPAEDAAALARTILRMAEMPESELKNMGDAGRCYFSKHFDPTALAYRLKEHFRKAISRS